MKIRKSITVEHRSSELQLTELPIIQTANFSQTFKKKEIEEHEILCSENDPGPSHNEAFEFLETAMKWLEWHKEC